MQTASIDILHYFHTHSLLIENALARLTQERLTQAPKLIEAARYALLNGGKRLRPILTLATVESFGKDPHSALIPACAIEMIHTYSLIHDDLPCMDDDDYRRGKLTVHKKYDQGHAVLTGDFLQTLAFEILATAPHLQADTRIQLLSTLAKRSGDAGMIGGQVMDLSAEGQTLMLEELESLHQKKTGALIVASLEFGAIIANVNASQMQHLCDFGQKIGLAFQIIDDILDVSESVTKHGREIASDILKEKSTYVSLLGLEEAKEYARRCHTRALAILKLLDCDTSLLEEIANFILQRKY